MSSPTLVDLAACPGCRVALQDLPRSPAATVAALRGFFLEHAGCGAAGGPVAAPWRVEVRPGR